MEQITLRWDVGTAYDFFVSLLILHEPEKVGLRGAWAAGVRARLPDPARDVLAQLLTIPRLPLAWLHQLPGPKDVATVLQTLAAIPPAERLTALFLSAEVPEPWQVLFRGVAARGSWEPAELDELMATRGDIPVKRRQLEGELALWAEAEAIGTRLLEALQSYQEVFFAEEEARIAPLLYEALAGAQALAETLSFTELLEQLSQGVRYKVREQVKTLWIAPSFWSTPLVVEAELGAGHYLYLFGARPAELSLVSGGEVPELLLQALKALADPTRLRILHHLAQAPMTPTELAKRLRLRAPTVVHHLHALRLARLVYLSLEEGVERRYAPRSTALDEHIGALRRFLEG